MSVSNVPQIQFTQTGLIIPAEADVLVGVQADIDAAFGGGLNPALETPQGQLASSQSAVIADKNNEVALIVNQVDPQYADGRFQDAIARIYFLTRKGAQATAVICTLGGLATTVIPAGTLAQDTNGNTYASEGVATIGITGTVDVSFQNLQTGPIPCAAGTLVKVYQSISGWDTITNAADGVMGSTVESRADFEYRRKNSVALNGAGSLPSVYANVFNVAGVIDVYATENPTNASVNTGVTNYPLAPHSLYVAVVGGADVDIANAIWLRKDIGCDYNGNTSVAVQDPSGYSYPQPSYTVKFQRPSSYSIKFAVQIANTPGLPSNIVQLVQAAIIARFNGADGTTRERIAALLFASRYYSAVAGVSSGVGVISVLLGHTAATLTTLQLGIDQSPTLAASDITVTLV